MTLRIRRAAPEDGETIAGLVRALARYERLEHEARATPDDFARALAAPGGPRALLADWAGQPCGIALYFFNFSTFLGRPGLYLEDLFVTEDLRGRGVGKALLVELARIARDHSCGRMEWSVLDWNAPSIAFYKSLGAAPMDEWTVYRLDRPALEKLAEG
ncbi:MAG: GNAT family N-acetyltransferase [Parvularculaceae bacterium]|jgi:GNAT superfamily N-acetyltransferase|nr:GNAT family N-acetyltransferase [Parvularculaceae bacterium]